MEVLLVILGLILAYLLIVYVILPLASVLSVIIIIASSGYGLITSLKSFFVALLDNINPYEKYIDKHENIPEGVKRNYFFGPGFNQLMNIIEEAFYNQAEIRRRLSDLKDSFTFYTWYIDMWVSLAYGVAWFCSQVLGFIWIALFSVLLCAVIITGMLLFFLLFSILWMIDRCVLLFHSIQSTCPNCKRLSIIPVFLCPECGLEHRNLVPGPYGVIKRKCSCGKMLATTFLGGRSQYEAHCRYCDERLYSSMSKQYGIQLVGGIGTGKTTFLVAFWHEYKEWLKKHKDVSFDPIPDERFTVLDELYESGQSEATLERNANMYSVIHTIDKKIPVQMTIYDIAGEAFETGNSEIQQQQFKHCNGFIIVIDPTSTGTSVSDSVTNFINLLDEMKGNKSSKLSKIPVAVIITKSDLYKRVIGLPKIKAMYNKQGISDSVTYEEYMSSICRKFLMNDFSNVINLLESQFINICYFPVSSIGHEANDSPYEPWGILQPVFWVMNNGKCPLRKMFEIHL